MRERRLNAKEKIELMAKIWVGLGGSAFGFELCYDAILEKIKELRK